LIRLHEAQAACHSPRRMERRKLSAVAAVMSSGLALAACGDPPTAPPSGEEDFVRGAILHGVAARGPWPEWSDVAAAYRSALTKNPNHAGARLALADVEVHLDREQDALHDYARSILAAPDWLEPYVEYADMLIREDDLAEARQVLVEAIARDVACSSWTFGLHTLLGSLEEREGDAPAAQADYAEGRRCLPL